MKKNYENVKEMIIDYMKENGFNALVGDWCGCGIDDLGLCENSLADCQFGYICKPDCARCECDCDARDTNVDECYKTEKDAPDNTGENLQQPTNKGL